MNTICIDQGNTRTKAAIYNMENKLLVAEAWNVAPAAETLLHFASLHHACAGVLCTTKDPDEELETKLKEQLDFFLKVDSSTLLPIANAYHSPTTLGPDRVAAVVAAQHDFPGMNNLVICTGSCITYNLITKNKTFRGGAISPGLIMRLKAMHDYTDRLPDVSPSGDLLLLGYDTETCMRSGAVYGIAAEMHGMLQAYNADYPEFNAILTGGDAAFFARHMKNKIFADPHLILKGLHLILRHNAPHLR